MSSTRHIFVLSGGAGTRLWPLSREAFPKQFYDLNHSGRPLLVETLQRLQGLKASLHVVTTEALKFSTLGIVKRFGLDTQLLGEPSPKNTAAAVALATWRALQLNPNSVVGVFPADHSISKSEKFQALVEQAFNEAEREGSVLTLGISPTYPATGYGYIELESVPELRSGGESSLKVLRFVEKPTEEKAKALIATRRVVWNAGMFVFRASTMAQHFKQFMPKLWSGMESLKPDLSNLPSVYSQLESQSIDYGVMEKLSDLRCLPADMGWSDIGAWEEVAKRGQSRGNPVEISGSGNFYTGLASETKRVAFVGLSDVVVVDTQDALLIVKKGEGQKVKDLVGQLKAEHSPLLTNHTFEERPWGRFEVLSDTENFKSKKISVWPGQKLSYQSHKKRSEHWVIVRGDAEVTLDDKKIQARPGDHIFIPVGAKHRIANYGKQVMEFIEVQTGTYFGEDDITRYSDEYGRV